MAMLKINILVILAFISFQMECFGEDGLVYNGDLNNDGIADKIESGPSGMFGAQGQNGPFILTLSVGGKSKKIGLGGTGIWILERYKNFLRFWGYNHLSASSGYMGYSQINLVSGELEKSERMLIYTGDGGTELGNLLGATIFENDKLEKCHCSKVKDYQPPELNELGEEWGK